MLTPKGKLPSTGGSEEVQTCNASSRTASPTHYQLSYSSPRLSISACHSMLTPDQPVLALTLSCQLSGQMATRVIHFEVTGLPQWGAVPRSLALAADAIPPGLQLQGSQIIKKQCVCALDSSFGQIGRRPWHTNDDDGDSERHSLRFFTISSQFCKSSSVRMLKLPRSFGPIGRSPWRTIDDDGDSERHSLRFFTISSQCCKLSTIRMLTRLRSCHVQIMSNTSTDQAFVTCNNTDSKGCNW